jgi:hypothetical protein
MGQYIEDHKPDLPVGRAGVLISVIALVATAVLFGFDAVGLVVGATAGLIASLLYLGLLLSRRDWLINMPLLMVGLGMIQGGVALFGHVQAAAVGYLVLSVVAFGLRTLLPARGARDS